MNIRPLKYTHIHGRSHKAFAAILDVTSDCKLNWLETMTEVQVNMVLNMPTNKASG